MSQRELLQTIREKTAKLRRAKERYNSLVRAVDSEMEEKLSKLGEQTLHVPLNLALTCIEALTKNRSLLPEVLDELQQILAFSSFGIDESDVELPPHNSRSPSSGSLASLKSGAPQSSQLPTTQVTIVGNAQEEEVEEALSGNDEIPTLRSIDLDAEEFLKQHEQQEELDVFNTSD
jgi:hypothetical protein